ncbi:hypothetical protein LWI28_026603 [Acer negundo]|uniref:Uncharacterized protein n=1 Tax=Acer negundo TaxID=4023 RepID=A0AAD5JB08_ACENE|nr:hypothetical protein LWI28_026603 [Acer negundo]
MEDLVDGSGLEVVTENEFRGDPMAYTCEVANCRSSVQECVEIEENDDQFESSIFESLTQQMVESIGREVVDKDHIESTNLVVEEIDKTIKSNIFEDLVTIPLALVGQSVGKLDIGFEDTRVRLGLVDVDFVWDGFEVKKDLIGLIGTLDPFHICFVGNPSNSMIVDMDDFETKGTRQGQWWTTWTLLAFH